MTKALFRTTQYVAKCSQCGREEGFSLGKNKWYGLSSHKFKLHALEGGIGKEWKELISTNPEGWFDSERALYACECGRWITAHTHDYYVPVGDAEAVSGAAVNQRKAKYRCIKRYKHYCPDCGRQMDLVDLKNEKLKCPVCGANMNTRIIAPDLLADYEKEKPTGCCEIECSRPMNRAEFEQASKAIKNLVHNEINSYFIMKFSNIADDAVLFMQTKSWDKGCHIEIAFDKADSRQITPLIIGADNLNYDTAIDLFYKVVVEAKNPDTIDFVRDHFKELRWGSHPAESDSGTDEPGAGDLPHVQIGTLFYKNGAVRFTGIYEELEDGTERYIEGSLYREDGKLWMEGTFQSASLLRGKEYYPNGQLMFDGEYTNGKPHSYYGPPYPLNGVLYDEAGNTLYTGHIPAGSKGGVGYPHILLPDGSFKPVPGLPSSHAGWDEKQKEYFRKTADFGRLPTFEEFNKRVEELFKEHYKDEHPNKLDDFYFGDETQEMVRKEYDSVCKEWHSKDITENIIMHGSAGGLAYCLYMLY